MSNRVINSLIFVLLTALSVNSTHEIVEHERSICELCLYSHANNDFDDLAPVTLSLPKLSHQHISPIVALLESDNVSTQDSIRAPPFFV